MSTDKDINLHLRSLFKSKDRLPNVQNKGTGEIDVLYFETETSDDGERTIFTLKHGDVPLGSVEIAKKRCIRTHTSFSLEFINNIHAKKNDPRITAILLACAQAYIRNSGNLFALINNYSLDDATYDVIEKLGFKTKYSDKNNQQKDFCNNPELKDKFGVFFKRDAINRKGEDYKTNEQMYEAARRIIWNERDEEAEIAGDILIGLKEAKGGRKKTRRQKRRRQTKKRRRRS